MTTEIEQLYARVARLERAVAGTATTPIDLAHGGVTEIARFVSFHTGQAAREILGDVRTGAVCRARYAVYWAAVRVLGWSMARTGRAIGDRDHTTIREGLRRAEELLDRDPAFRLLCQKITGYFGREWRQ